MKFDRLAVVSLVCIWLFGCGANDLDGPERIEFDDVERVELDVESGEVYVLGSANSEGAVVNRWWSGDDDFEQLAERNSAQRLVVESICRGGWSCEARYEMTVQRSAPVDARIGRGLLRLMRIRGHVEAELGEGQLVGRGLKSRLFDADVQRGRVDVKFVEAPDHIRLKLGDSASARVELPEERYRCDFDEEAGSVDAGDLECNRHVGERIQLDPPDADVTFRVQ